MLAPSAQAEEGPPAWPAATEAARGVRHAAEMAAAVLIKHGKESGGGGGGRGLLGLLRGGKGAEGKAKARLEVGG